VCAIYRPYEERPGTYLYYHLSPSFSQSSMCPASQICGSGGEAHEVINSFESWRSRRRCVSVARVLAQEYNSVPQWERRWKRRIAEVRCDRERNARYLNWKCVRDGKSTISRPRVIDVTFILLKQARTFL